MSAKAIDIDKEEKIKRGSPNPERLLTIEQAAPYLGQKDHWGVRNLINNHGLPVVRYGKRGMRVDKNDIDTWIQKHKESVTF